MDILYYVLALVTKKAYATLAMFEPNSLNNHKAESEKIMSPEELTEQLYNSHYTPLFRYLFFRVRNKNDAEDLTQTVFVKAYSSLKNGVWDGGGDIHYLFTIARNTLIDHFRRGKHAPIVSDELLTGLADEVLTDGFVEDREKRELVALVISKLSDAEAEAVTMRYISDMEYGAIAKLMGKREDAVRQLVHRGLKALKTHLKNEGVLD